MIAVIFELQPNADQTQRYFDIAAELKPQLETIDGFISIERFKSVSQPGRYLSLSFWRDEDSVRRWRCCADHRAAQQQDRSQVLAAYRLRVAAVLRDYGLDERAQAPQDSQTALV